MGLIPDNSFYAIVVVFGALRDIARNIVSNNNSGEDNLSGCLVLGILT